MGSNKITGMAPGTVATDAANLSQVQSTAAKLITPSGVDTITGVMSPVLSAYAAGQMFYFVAAGANTGPVTLNIDGLGARAVTRDGATALAAGDINSGEIVVVVYDGTRFQMINAANSFGNTTINGTLTVTGNAGFQANVSITSALSVGGTLTVTGKTDLGAVSAASANATVGVITTLTATQASIASANVGTAVVTNLTATGASVASINAAVALFTTATVTNLTATGASIASANIGALGAVSIGSANIGTAVITALTATSASIASANAGNVVATTLTATGASVASANVGTAVVTGLTATSASVASANLGTAVVTDLTATGASIASANLGTANIAALTLTGVSVASANVGVANITDLRATLAKAFNRFSQLQQIHLQTVQRLLLCADALCEFLQSLRALRERSFCTHRALPCFIRQHLLRSNLTNQIVDFLLTRQHAILLGIRRMKTY